MAQGFPRSHASNSGWWAGVPSGERLNFSHLLPIPPDALTLTRGALIEVEYTIRVSLNASFTGVCVDLPLRIVNLLSLDPPPLPTCDMYARSQSLGAETPQSASSNPNDQDCDSSDTSNGDENDGVFQTSCPEDAQDEFQLGNLSMCDDAEDLVHHAMVSAQIHQTTEQAAEEPSEPETPEPSSSTEPDPHSDPASGPISRPSRPRVQSSFPPTCSKEARTRCYRAAVFFASLRTGRLLRWRQKRLRTPLKV
ncbi:Polysaccharide lyase family 8 protein [Mycena sanguinolenta]|uniref:Polysaccharide lyase family 8 protein n=1 Tax=Mycena sanguinolenta TaxID=230812 RepID=A0A8H6XDY4_9AGAR|nr:Polysaccharide lyase family 8 protein [Mycena sanguinolenta]